jgi:hypothetical protein
MPSPPPDPPISDVGADVPASHKREQAHYRAAIAALRRSLPACSQRLRRQVRDTHAMDSLWTSESRNQTLGVRHHLVNDGYDERLEFAGARWRLAFCKLWHRAQAMVSRRYKKRAQRPQAHSNHGRLNACCERSAFSCACNCSIISAALPDAALAAEAGSRQAVAFVSQKRRALLSFSHKLLEFCKCQCRCPRQQPSGMANGRQGSLFDTPGRRGACDKVRLPIKRFRDH